MLECDKVNDVLNKMIRIYKPKDIDWMGFKMTNDNPYTFHHIIEHRDGGLCEITNGAILTDSAHRYLNYLDLYIPEAYEEYQKIFRFINSLNGPIPESLYNDLYEEIYTLAYEIEVLKIYPIMEEPKDFKKERKLKRLITKNRKL